jgi:hypothetical protein
VLAAVHDHDANTGRGADAGYECLGYAWLLVMQQHYCDLVTLIVERTYHRKGRCRTITVVLVVVVVVVVK